MPKTIQELNQEWWYRLVKVVFIFCFILIQSVGLFIVVFFVNNNKVEKITQGSLINIGKQIKKDIIGDLWDKQNPSKIRLLEKDESQFATRELWLEYIKINYQYPNEGWVKEIAAKTSYVESQIKNITDKEFFTLGSQAFYNNYQNYTKKYDQARESKSVDQRIAELEVSVFRSLEEYEYVDKYSILQKVIFCLISVIIVIIIFTIIQRIFYYIAFGKLAPPKEST